MQTGFIRVKLATCGPAASGKTSLIKRFCENKYNSKYIATIGVDYGVKAYDVQAKGGPSAPPFHGAGAKSRINFFDLSGSSSYYHVRAEFYRDLHVLLVVFDLSSRGSFERTEEFIEEARASGLEAATDVVLCANKADLKRAVSREEAEGWAVRCGYSYYETSAADGSGVETAFRETVDAALHRIAAAPTAVPASHSGAGGSGRGAAAM